MVLLMHVSQRFSSVVVEVLAERFGVSESTVRSVRSGRTWCEVSGVYPVRFRGGESSVLSWREVTDLRRLFASGVSVSVLAKRFGVSVSTVRRWARGL